MLRLRFLLVLTCAVLCSPRAHAAPIVFDFEDGLQGWRTSGFNPGAQRVKTQLLGGEWAVFGDGLLRDETITVRHSRPVFLAAELDLTGVQSMSAEFIYLGSLTDLRALEDPSEFLSAILIDIDAGDIFRANRVDLLRVETTSARRGTVFWDLGEITGIPGTRSGRGVGIMWSDVYFIDNITFHPVPEPSTFGLVGIGLAALAIARRRTM